LAKKTWLAARPAAEHIEKARQRRKRVEQLLLEGLSWREICGREQIDRATMSEDAAIIYAAAWLAPRAGVKALAEKLGVQIGEKYARAREPERAAHIAVALWHSKRQIAKR